VIGTNMIFTQNLTDDNRLFAKFLQ